jgi:hypothetical protein
MSKSKFRLGFVTTPSFLLGAGNVLNIAGNNFGFKMRGAASDLEAIRSDWVKVGSHINSVIEEAENIFEF